jgi:hypothetical protein
MGPGGIDCGLLEKGVFILYYILISVTQLTGIMIILFILFPLIKD